MFYVKPHADVELFDRDHIFMTASSGVINALTGIFDDLFANLGGAEGIGFDPETGNITNCKQFGDSGAAPGETFEVELGDGTIVFYTKDASGKHWVCQTY